MNKKSNRPKALLPSDACTTLAIKCYEEQCGGNFQNTLKLIAKLDSNKYWCFAIIHQEINAKPHMHVALSVKSGTRRVKNLLKMLEIRFRDEDENLLKNRSLETVGNLYSYFIYLTHKDDKSVELGKKEYEVSDFVSNINLTQFSNKLPVKKLSKRETLFNALCSDSKASGYNNIPFDDFISKNVYAYNQFNSQLKLEIMNFYNQGVRQKEAEERVKNTPVSYLPTNLMLVINIFQATNLNFKNISTIIESFINKLVYQKKYHLNLDNIEIWNNTLLYTHHSPAYNSLPTRPFISRENNLKGIVYKIVIVNNKNTSSILDNKNKKYYYCNLEDRTLKCPGMNGIYDQGSDNEREFRLKLYKAFKSEFESALEKYYTSQIENQIIEKTKKRKEIDYSDIF